MREAKNSPSPWAYDEFSHGEDAIVDSNGYLIVHISHFTSIQDRNLIVAAPELLEALKRCRFDSLNMSLTDLKFCRAAIAKATGEAA